MTERPRSDPSRTSKRGHPTAVPRTDATARTKGLSSVAGAPASPEPPAPSSLTRLTRRATGITSAAVSDAPAGGEHDDLQEARRLVVKMLGPQHARLFLFGSRARGDSRRGSDIDIALLPEVPLPPGTLAHLREALEESHIPYRVEIVDLSTTTETFRRKVLAEAIPWND